MQTALLEFTRQIGRMEPFLIALLVLFLALASMIYMLTLRRIRSDLRLFGECLLGSFQTKGPGSAPIQFRSRDVKRISEQMNNTLQAHSHRVSRVLEYLKSAETRIDTLAKASAFLLKASQEQEHLFRELHQTLGSQSESVQKWPAELTARMSNIPLDETGDMLSSAIEKLGAALDRSVEVTEAVKSFEDIGRDLQNLAHRLLEVENDTQDLSLNARLAIAHSPGSSAEHTVTSGAQTLEQKIQDVTKDLLSKCEKIRHLAECARTAQRAGNLRLLEGSQGVEEARRDLRGLSANLRSCSQQIMNESNTQHEQLRKALSMLESLCTENQRTIAVSEHGESISTDAIGAALKIREELHLPTSSPIEAQNGTSPDPSLDASLAERVSALSKPESSDKEI